MATSEIEGKRRRLQELQRRVAGTSSEDDAAPPRDRGTLASQRARLRELQRRVAARPALESAPPPPEPGASPGYQPVAIIGMDGMVPGASTIQEFWNNLEQDKCCISEIPRDRFDWREHHDPTGRDIDKMRTKWGGFLSDIRSFDYEFFSMLPREAELIDPQQRLLLMSVYRAIEDAGYARDSLKGARVGVYVGVEDNEFLQHLREERIDLGLNGFNHHPSMMANRISHYFDLRGPSEIVNTMCSAAAVAMHRACSAIGHREIEMAVVGAARIILRPEPLIGLSRMGVLSPVATVKSFGRDADGYLRAEGVGSIVLKSLRLAEADGDHIYAVIKSSAINFNGQGGMSMAAPNREAHVAVIKECHERAGIDPNDLDYIEAQGMGNQVGDIAEWEACNRALEQLNEARGQTPVTAGCRVSSVKPMIGHMECMSALGALFKIIGSLTNNRLYGVYGLEDVNPYLAIEDRPCRLLRQSEPWSPKPRPRLAALHSYGSGGNNAHLLIEEYVAARSSSVVSIDMEGVNAMAGGHLFVFSAPDEDRLREGLKAFVRHLHRNPALSLADVAHTLLYGRTRFARRVAIVADSPGQLVRDVDAYLRGNVASAKVFALHLGDREPAAATWLARAARRWLAGESVDGAEIGITGRARRISLPGYQFRQTRCWPDRTGSSRDAARLEAGAMVAETSNASDVGRGERPRRGYSSAGGEPHFLPGANTPASSDEAAQRAFQKTLADTLADMLRLAPAEVQADKKFGEYGFDSITLVGLAARLAASYPSISLPTTVFLEHPTLAELAVYLAREHTTETRIPQRELPAKSGHPGDERHGRGRREPMESQGDLQLLNRGGGGAPVFWFHGALGTVQNFIPVAKRLGKDVRFYGVQSRAVRAEITPSEDLSLLARSYCDLLIEANEDLPFHLGGYSQGGALAVEVTRQLQRMGRSVKSIVMIDTPFPPVRAVFSEKLNHVLALANLLQINGKSISGDIPELLSAIEGKEEYWEAMISYGLDKGLSYSEKELGRVLQKFHRITRANVKSMEQHVLQPLSLARETECILFQRSAPGAFFSEALCLLEEAVRHNRYFADNRCAERWKEVIPTLRLHPTAATDHFSILEEESVLAEICRKCRELYAFETSG
jgi:3-oxoacyl-(acyl-carrier-protein) synthase/thioesterase domain-containing protein